LSTDSEEFEHSKDASILSVKDDEDVSDSMFSFMATSEDDEAGVEVTLSYIKQNLNIYSIEKLRSLASVLIESISELTEKDLLNNNLDIFQYGKFALD